MLHIKSSSASKAVVKRVKSTQQQVTSYPLARSPPSNKTPSSTIIRKRPLGTSATTRLPIAGRPSSKPIASLSSSPLSPTISNGGGSAMSESTSERSSIIPRPIVAAVKHRNINKTQVNTKTSSSLTSPQSLTRTSTSSATLTPKTKLLQPAVSRSTLSVTTKVSSVLPRLTRKPNGLHARNTDAPKNSQVNDTVSLLSSASTSRNVKSRASLSVVSTKLTTKTSANEPKASATTCEEEAALLPCGRPTSADCFGQRLSGQAKVIQLDQQQTDHDVDSKEAPIQRDATSNLSTQAPLGKQQREHGATIASSTTTIRFKPAATKKAHQQEERKGGVPTAGTKNEAAILNNKDVNGGSAAGPATTGGAVFLANSTPHRDDHEDEDRDEAHEKMDEKEANTGDHEDEMSNLARESKQDEHHLHHVSAQAEQEQIAKTTSGQQVLQSTNSDSNSNKTRANLRSPPAACHGQAVSPPSSSLRGNKSTLPLTKTAPFDAVTMSMGDKNGQFLLTEKFHTASSLPTTMTNCEDADLNAGKKQHENRLEAPTSGYSLGPQHKHHDSAVQKASKNGSGMTQPPTTLQQKQAEFLANNCYKSSGGHQKSQTPSVTRRAGAISQVRSSTANKTTPAASGRAQTSALNCSRYNAPVTKAPSHSPSSAPTRARPAAGSPLTTTNAISDRVRPRPMGHQVLSLMMLDAGLLPANSNQQASGDEDDDEDDKSHVCLQSEAGSSLQLLYDCYRGLKLPLGIAPQIGRDANNNNDKHCNMDSAKTLEHSDVSSLIDAISLHKDGCNEQTAIQIPPLATLEKAANHNFTSLKSHNGISISLPSSPKLAHHKSYSTSTVSWSESEEIQTKSGVQKQQSARFESTFLGKLKDLSLARKKAQRSTDTRTSQDYRWLSPVAARCNIRTISGCDGSPRLSSSHLTLDVNNVSQAIAGTHSIASSSCSSLNNHCPPLLALSNQLSGMEFHEMIRANVNESFRKMKQEQQDQVSSATTISDSRNASASNPAERCRAKQQDQVQVESEQSARLVRNLQQGLEFTLEDDLIRGGSEDKPSKKIDRLDSPDKKTSEKRSELSASGVSLNESELEYYSDGEGSGSKGSKIDEQKLSICQTPTPSGLRKTNNQLMLSDRIPKPLDESQLSNGNGSRCYQQPRSNSISGQEFHHLGGEYHHMTAHQQRLKQQANHHLNQSPYVDANQCYSQRLQNFTQYKQNLLADRSASPASLTTQRPTDFYMPKRSSSIKYSYDTRQMPPVRNNIHASLECLNTIYSDYSQSQNQKQQQQLSTTNQLRQYQQQHFQHQLSGLQTNQHYAAGYVLAAVPPDTVVNRSAEQDLAAAAMGAPPSQQYNQTMVSSAASNMTMNNSLNQSSGLHASSNYQSQNLLSRAQQTTHSPLHRSRLGQGHGAVANILNHISSSSNPMRAGHSSLSLASSTYLIEDKLQNEIKQLQSELKSEREKNEALSSQLNINSNLMAAFEQSLNTLNNRLRQLTALNEKKDKEIDELRAQLEMSNNSNLSVDKMTKAHCGTSEKSTSPICGEQHLQIKLDYDTQDSMMSPNATSPHDNATSDSPSPFHSNSKSSSSDPRLAYKSSEGDQNLLRVIEDLKRQLIEKDRLLTDTRLEALSAAHQLEQLESRLNGEHSLLVNDDDLDEGVMVANHSPSDSDAITDSAHFSDNHSHSGSKFSHLNQQQSILQRQQHKMQQPNYQNHLPYQQQQNQQSNQRGSANLEDMMLFTPTHIGQHTSNNTSSLSNNSNNSVDDTNAMINLSLNQSNNLNHKLQQQDNQSNHSSSDYHVEDKSSGDTTIQREYNSAEAIGNTADEPTSEQTFESRRADNEAMTKMLDNLLVST